MEPLIASALLSTAVGAGNIASEMSRPKRQYKWNKKAAEDANRMNRENQQWLLDQQLAIQREQREYDSPQAQMARYIAAGLNPNLIYGSGSSAGQVFPIDAGSVAPVRIDPPAAAAPDFGALIRNAQTVMNTRVAEQRMEESGMRTQLIEVQKEIAKHNPMLRPEVAASVADMVDMAAREKATTSFYWTSPDSKGNSRIEQKIRQELEAGFQRLGLNTKDLELKNKILESKEFENFLKEIQVNWMKDADITPEHIRQAGMMLLNKMF